MIEILSQRECWGTHRTYRESLKFEGIVREVYSKTAAEVFGQDSTPDMAVFSYGSPSRLEFAGGDSDADVFLAERVRTKKGRRFRERFEASLGTYGFSKVDLPHWGTLAEVDKYLEVSLVEGNQVLETRFLAGDAKIKQEVEKSVRRFDSPEREIANIVFNRLYFDQYFKQRARAGFPNIKYCPGGSREFLFFYWYDRLCNKMEGRDSSLSGIQQPKVKEGLERLFMEGSITGGQFGLSLEAVNALIEIRTDALKVNKGTPQRGLTILDKEMMESLRREFGYPVNTEIVDQFTKYSSRVRKAADVAFGETIKRAAQIKGEEWQSKFLEAINSETSEGDRMQIPCEDVNVRVASLWGATNSDQRRAFNAVANRYSSSTDWGTLCSIACSPLVGPRILHEIGTGIAKEKGYGYILRVVARNKKVSRETLTSIAEDPALEKRYKEVAISALEGGNSQANNLI